MPDSRLTVTVLVDGLPEPKEYASALKVDEVLKSLLPAGEEQNWEQYQIVDKRLSNDALDPKKSLRELGVQDGDTLSFTKKEGGGGVSETVL